MTGARHRTRPTANVPTPSDAQDVPPDVERMRKVLELTAGGRTQKEIAAVLGITDRAVRGILKAARTRQLATWKARSPEAVVADYDHRTSTQLARWNSLWARARASNDLRAEAVALSRLDAMLSHRMAVLTRIGFFDGVTFLTGQSGNEVDRQAQRARRELNDILMMSAALNRGEDIETLEIGKNEAAENFDPDDPLYG